MFTKTTYINVTIWIYCDFKMIRGDNENDQKSKNKIMITRLESF